MAGKMAGEMGPLLSLPLPLLFLLPSAHALGPQTKRKGLV